MAKKESRTKRTLQNSRMSLLLFIIQVFVGFYSRKVFLDYLGSEVIGLNTTLGNILSFLNLAELVFLSSAGIRVIFKLQKGVLQKKGVVVISKPQPQVAKVIEIIRALPAEQVFASDEEADRYLAMIQRQYEEGK